MNEVGGIKVADIIVWDMYGSYPVNSILCHDLVWKYALHRMLDRADLVTMDLAGFSEDHSGAEYEIGYLIDKYPIERVVFLVDRASDTSAVEEGLRASWSAMADGSPNRTAPVRVRIIQTGGMYLGDSSPNMPTETRIIGAGTADARRIVARLPLTSPLASQSRRVRVWI